LKRGKGNLVISADSSLCSWFLKFTTLMILGSYGSDLQATCSSFYKQKVNLMHKTLWADVTETWQQRICPF